MLAGVEVRAWVRRGRNDELRWKSGPALGFPSPRAGEPQEGGPCLARDRSLCAPSCLDPAARLGLRPGTLGKLSQTCLVLGLDASELAAGSAEVPGGRGCRAGVRACGCVHERGPERHTLTHTHSHARTHAGPSAAPPAPPWTSPSSPDPPGPAPGGLSPPKGTQRAGFGSQDRERRRGLPTTRCPARPPGEGAGKGAGGSYRSGGRVRAGAPGGPAPPRRQGWRGRGRRADRRADRRGTWPSCPAPPRGPPRAGPAPGAPPQPRSAGGVRARPSPGWEGPLCASHLLGKPLFQLCPRGRAGGAPDPRLFQGAPKSPQAVLPGRGRSSSARVCHVPKAR